MKIVSIALLLLLAACSSQPAQVHYYLMRADSVPESQSLAASADYALGSVTIAAYIDQPGMVLEVEGGQIQAALFNKWAEPMTRGVRSFLQVTITKQLGEALFASSESSADTLVEINIDQLHGTNDGKAVLSAYWWLKRDGKVLEAYQVGETIALKSDGYGALADAEQALLARLAKRIATQLKARSAQ